MHFFVQQNNTFDSGKISTEESIGKKLKKMCRHLFEKFSIPLIDYCNNGVDLKLTQLACDVRDTGVSVLRYASKNGRGIWVIVHLTKNIKILIEDQVTQLASAKKKHAVYSTSFTNQISTNLTRFHFFAQPLSSHSIHSISNVSHIYSSRWSSDRFYIQIKGTYQ